MSLWPLLVLLLVLVAAGFLAYARFSPMDPARWHADPATARPTGWPNDFLLRPRGIPGKGGAEAGVYALPAPELARRLVAALLAEPGTTVLAGDPVQGFVTLVQRSRVFRFPDVIAIRAIPLSPETATLAIYSRARFGNADAGVNRARVQRLLRAVADDLKP